MMVVGAPVISISSSCSSGADDPTPGGIPNCLENGTASAIAANHGHSITVSKTDVENGAEKKYAIQGTSGHNHDITVSETDFTTLQNNQSITVTSTNNSGHNHSVTISCA